MKDNNLYELLHVVIENYIFKGDPIGSKFLHTLEWVEYAPSTLRKYLNLLEKEGLVYQPYNSSGRIPTVEWLSKYIDTIINENDLDDNIDFDIETIRNSLRHIVETISQYVDGAVVWFVRNDDYFFLGINNLLKEDMVSEYDTTKKIIKFVEDKKIIAFLDEKIIKLHNIHYTFINDEEKIISCIYTKIMLHGYDCILSIIGPTRMDYKKNFAVIKKFLSQYQHSNTPLSLH